MEDGTIYAGVVDVWYPKKRFGFIIPTDRRLGGVPSVFVHADDIIQEPFAGIAVLTNGQPVQYCLAKDDQSRIYATMVRSTDGSPTAIEVCDVQIGNWYTGEIEKLFPDRGYGFVTIDNSPGNYFFQVKSRVPDMPKDDLRPGLRVVFKLRRPRGGKLEAIELQHNDENATARD